MKRTCNHEFMKTSRKRTYTQKVRTLQGQPFVAFVYRRFECCHCHCEDWRPENGR